MNNKHQDPYRPVLMTDIYCCKCGYFRACEHPCPNGCDAPPAWPMATPKGQASGSLIDFLFTLACFVISGLTTFALMIYIWGELFKRGM